MRHSAIFEDEVNFQDHFVGCFWIWYWYGIGMHIIANIGMVYHTNIGNDMLDHTNTWYWYTNAIPIPIPYQY
jgi:hypothetical protein